MPLYEYRCQSCGEKFEVMQKFSDAPLSVHDKCGGTVQRLISAPVLQFKGSGWYVTDYAKSGSSGDQSANSGDGASKKTDTPAAAASSDSSAATPSGSSSDKKSSSPDTK